MDYYYIKNQNDKLKPRNEGDVPKSRKSDHVSYPLTLISIPPNTNIYLPVQNSARPREMQIKQINLVFRNQFVIKSWKEHAN